MSFLLPFVLSLLSVLAAGALIRVQARTQLVSGQVRRRDQLLSSAVLGSGLWSAQTVLLLGHGLPISAAQGGLHWLVVTLLVTGFLRWYRHHAQDGPLRVTVALLLTVTAAQVAGLSGYAGLTLTPHWPDLLALTALAAAVSLGAASLVRRPGLSGGAQLLTVTVGQSVMITLLAHAFATLLPAGALTEPPGVSAVAVAVAAALAVVVAGGLVGDAQQRRAQRFEALVRERTAELSAERDFHVALLDSLYDQVVISDAEGHLVMNEAAGQLHHGSPSGTLAPDWAATYGLHTPDFTRLLTQEEVPLFRALQGEAVRAVIIGVQNTTRRNVFACNATPIRNAQGQVTGAVVAMNNVTERERAQQDLIRTAAQHAAIIESLDEALLLLDADGRILSRNSRVADLLGDHAIQAQTLPDLLAPLVVRDTQGRVMQGRSPNFQALTSGSAQFTQSIMHLERADGQHMWLHSRAQVRTHDDGTSDVLFLFRDVTDQHELNEQLVRVTRFAPVSALPNRAHFQDLAAAAASTPGRSLLAVQCLNITELRTGQADLADQLTLAFSRTLSDTYPNALLGQLDERTFALLLPEPPTDLRPSLLDPVHLAEDTVFPRVRACARPWPASESAAEALQAVESSLPLAQEGALLLFEDRHLDLQRRRLMLDGALRRALDRRDFQVHYQPIVDLDTGQIVKAEALVRWADPVCGRVPPDQFIPLAEQMGQIHVITDFVIRTALLEARRGSTLLGRPLRIAVNLSPTELNAPNFMARMQALMDEFPDAPAHLAFEVTESGVLVNLAQVTQDLSALRSWGFGLALDDFGTGHSALSVLQHLPIHHLKLDRTFVWGIDGNDRLQVLTGAVMELASRLRFEVIAEGIETLEHEAILREMGCTLGQGYLYSPPSERPDWAALDGWTSLR
ncbi:EAL domain-containing protein [Deinococcus sedimenti]|uniref:EAL domain-containing protein n=1 Tax=Deinococcus sedimenti TaxID=1867090 RepID=A0ABQ2S6N8_9DEIO|nr:EAL domain-containing protein [Deinococcus sedimenti]GGR93461.1 hypothetical protein GCM10008960_20560 [Deinococcus sedimenti]